MARSTRDSEGLPLWREEWYVMWEKLKECGWTRHKVARQNRFVVPGPNASCYGVEGMEWFTKEGCEEHVRDMMLDGDERTGELGDWAWRDAIEEEGWTVHPRQRFSAPGASLDGTEGVDWFVGLNAVRAYRRTRAYADRKAAMAAAGNILVERNFMEDESGSITSRHVLVDDDNGPAARARHSTNTGEDESRRKRLRRETSRRDAEIEDLKATLAKVESEKAAAVASREEVLKCVVCMEDVDAADGAPAVRKNTVLLPCSHLAVCDGCARKLFGKPCPICRATVTGLVRCHLVE